MSGQHVQCACGQGNFGTVRSMMSRPRESEISSVKYGISELAFGLSCCCVTCNLYCSRSWGVICMIHSDLFVKHSWRGQYTYGVISMCMCTHSYVVELYIMKGPKLWYGVQYLAVIVEKGVSHIFESGEDVLEFIVVF